MPITENKRVKLKALPENGNSLAPLDINRMNKKNFLKERNSQHTAVNRKSTSHPSRQNYLQTKENFKFNAKRTRNLAKPDESSELSKIRTRSSFGIKPKNPKFEIKAPISVPKATEFLETEYPVPQLMLNTSSFNHTNFQDDSNFNLNITKLEHRESFQRQAEIEIPQWSYLSDEELKAKYWNRRLVSKEDSSDEAYQTRHSRHEIEEIRMERRSLQLLLHQERLAEMALKENRKRKAQENSQFNPDMIPTLLTLSPSKANRINICHKVPVIAFGSKFKYPKSCGFSLDYLKRSLRMKNIPSKYEIIDNCSRG